MFEGVPTYPDAGRFWQVVEKHRVSVFYTAPTALRALMGQGDDFVKKHDRSSLRVLGSVGEPINPEAWEWYYHVVGEGRCPIADTWWQTETGGVLIAPYPGATALKPGSATRPCFGVEPCLVDDKGNELDGATSGALCIKRSWPGQMRTVYGDHQRFIDTYFKTFPGRYFTGDGARRDEDGYYWITGRVDDVINVSGHRMGTAEVESALVLHDAVAEAAVVGFPHDIKGQGIYAYVTLMQEAEPSRNCAGSWSCTCARRSAPSPARTRSSGRQACPRPVPARSCAASCARSRPTNWTTWATPAPWPIPPWLTTWSRTGQPGNSIQGADGRDQSDGRGQSKIASARAGGRDDGRGQSKITPARAGGRDPDDFTLTPYIRGRTASPSPVLK